MAEIGTLGWLGIAAAGYFLFIKPGQTANAGNIANNAMTAATNSPGQAPAVTMQQPGAQGVATLYPYLVAGAPLPLPASYNQSYYLQYVYPNMIQVDSNVKSPQYVPTQAEANQYLANYVDIQQWLPSLPNNKTPYQHLVYHWQTYGVPQQRTFLPLWSINPSQWVPPPPSAKSGGVWSDVLQTLTVVGAGAAEVASGGALTAVIAPAASSALALESKISGTAVLADNELETLFCGAAILNNILPFYLSADKPTVKAIYARLDDLLKQYS